MGRFLVSIEDVLHSCYETVFHNFIGQYSCTFAQILDTKTVK
jgi:hypothetical protein